VTTLLSTQECVKPARLAENEVLLGKCENISSVRCHLVDEAGPIFNLVNGRTTAGRSMGNGKGRKMGREGVMHIFLDNDWLVQQ